MSRKAGVRNRSVRAAGLGLVAALCAAAHTVSAQQLRGSVSDSATRRPLPGVVVVLLDSSGITLGRNISNERGAYAIALMPGAQRLRLQRIGFRPREVRIPPLDTGALQIDVALLPIPTFLEAVRVTAGACSPRPDRGSALALYEQARAGLLATIVARETNPGELVLLSFERTMDGMSDRIARQTVRRDSLRRARVSYHAAQNAAGFLQRGFVKYDGREYTYLAPDAEVLLDEGFARGYCFRLADPDPRRPNQVGLGFVAANRVRDRVDIDGALWIDTVARALRDIEFQYVGLESRLSRFRPGGRIEFREMHNGVVLVDRWHLRLVGAHPDSIRNNRDPSAPMAVRANYYWSEGGGELARASWPDGHSWRASLGGLRLHAVDSTGAPKIGAELWLYDTPYRARVDSSGMFVVTDLLPGPYVLVVVDRRLAPLLLNLPTAVTFTAVRDSTHHASLEVQTAERYVADRCRADRRYETDSSIVLARVMTPGGDPVGGVAWRVRKREGGSAGGEWRIVRQGGETGTDGLFQLCSRQLRRNDLIWIQVYRHGRIAGEAERRLTDRLTVIAITLEP